jgi:hypothetical protein
MAAIFASLMTRMVLKVNNHLAKPSTLGKKTLLKSIWPAVY